MEREHEQQVLGLYVERFSRTGGEEEGRGGRTPPIVLLPVRPQRRKGIPGITSEILPHTVHTCRARSGQQDPSTRHSEMKLQDEDEGSRGTYWGGRETCEPQPHRLQVAAVPTESSACRTSVELVSTTSEVPLGCGRAAGGESIIEVIRSVGAVVWEPSIWRGTEEGGAQGGRG